MAFARRVDPAHPSHCHPLQVAAERHPTALLPKPLARTLGFGLLALLGAAEWRRMIDGAGLLGALGWVGGGC